jgi:hypothetical protein
MQVRLQARYRGKRHGVSVAEVQYDRKELLVVNLHVMEDRLYVVIFLELIY